MNKYKKGLGRGWHYQSNLHSLCAKGISTGRQKRRYRMKFIDAEDLMVEKQLKCGCIFGKNKKRESKALLCKQHEIEIHKDKHNINYAQMSVSRYSKGDTVLYGGKAVKVVDVDKFSNGIAWQNSYIIDDAGERKEVRAKELKLIKSIIPKSKINLRKIEVPEGWKFNNYDKSNFYNYKSWSYVDESKRYPEGERNNGVQILYRENTDDFDVSWWLKNKSVEDFNKYHIKTLKDAVSFAQDVMKKIKDGKVKMPKWAE